MPLQHFSRLRPAVNRLGSKETRVEEKRCSRCGETKPLTEFNKKTPTRPQPYCRTCNSAYLKAHYAANVEYYVAKARRTKRRMKRNVLARLEEYFADHPCVDCGETDSVVLQFDHVRGTKIMEVSRMWARGRSWAAIEAEIAKCDVRSANCHIRRTAEVRGWYAYRDT